VTRGAAVALTVVAGSLVALQAPINSKLGRSVGTFQGAFVSFAVGMTVLLAFAAVTGGGLGATRAVAHVPWWYLLGGLLGAVYVTTILISVRTLGAGGVTAATVAGQLTMSVLVDQFGWLGVARNQLSAPRLAGIVLLVLGVALIVRD